MRLKAHCFENLIIILFWCKSRVRRMWTRYCEVLTGLLRQHNILIVSSDSSDSTAKLLFSDEHLCHDGNPFLPFRSEKYLLVCKLSRFYRYPAAIEKCYDRRTAWPGDAKQWRNRHQTNYPNCFFGKLSFQDKFQPQLIKPRNWLFTYGLEN